MQLNVDVNRVLDQNRRFHDEVEAKVYNQRMGVRHDDEAVQSMIAELEGVFGGPLPHGVAVIDVGAGSGNVAVKLARDRRFASVTAVDISAGMLQLAESAAAANGCEINTINSDMRPLPFEDDSADLIVGCAMLHHMPEPAVFLSEVYRVLKPGAAAIFIGEPSTWGERITNFVKLPIFFALGVYRLCTGRRPKIWEHDMIDVHTFSIREIQDMTRDFAKVQFRPEGFLEPIIDQGLLVPFQLALGKLPGVAKGCILLRRCLRWVDRWTFNRLAPRSILASIKFASWK